MQSFKPLKIFIIGGVAAGMSAAVRARKNDPRSEITVIQKEEQVSYGACGFPYYISGEVGEIETIIGRTQVEYEQQSNKILKGHDALDFNSR